MAMVHERLKQKPVPPSGGATAAQKVRKAFTKFFDGDVDGARNSVKAGTPAEIDKALGGLRVEGLKQLLASAGAPEIQKIYDAASRRNTKKILDAATKGQLNEAVGVLPFGDILKMLEAADFWHFMKLADAAGSDVQLQKVLVSALNDEKGELPGKLVDFLGRKQIPKLVGAADACQLRLLIDSVNEKQIRKLVENSDSESLNKLFKASGEAQVMRMLNSIDDYRTLVERLDRANLGKALAFADYGQLEKFLETVDNKVELFRRGLITESSDYFERAGKIYCAMTPSIREKLERVATTRQMQTLHEASGENNWPG